MSESRQISVKLPKPTLERLEAMAAERGHSRAAMIRVLIEADAPAGGVASGAEALRLLSESARAGSIQAQIALERALRAAGPEPEGDLLDELARRRGVA